MRSCQDCYNLNFCQDLGEILARSWRVLGKILGNIFSRMNLGQILPGKNLDKNLAKILARYILAKNLAKILAGIWTKKSWQFNCCSVVVLGNFIIVFDILLKISHQKFGKNYWHEFLAILAKNSCKNSWQQFSPKYLTRILALILAKISSQILAKILAKTMPIFCLCSNFFVRVWTWCLLHSHTTFEFHQNITIPRNYWNIPPL